MARRQRRCRSGRAEKRGTGHAGPRSGSPRPAQAARTDRHIWFDSGSHVATATPGTTGRTAQPLRRPDARKPAQGLPDGISTGRRSACPPRAGPGTADVTTQNGICRTLATAGPRSRPRPWAVDSPGRCWCADPRRSRPFLGGRRARPRARSDGQDSAGPLRPAWRHGCADRSAAGAGIMAAPGSGTAPPSLLPDGGLEPRPRRPGPALDARRPAGTHAGRWTAELRYPRPVAGRPTTNGRAPGHPAPRRAIPDSLPPHGFHAPAPTGSRCEVWLVSGPAAGDEGPVWVAAVPRLAGTSPAPRRPQPHHQAPPRQIRRMKSRWDVAQSVGGG
jgi:hypothetical protein